MSRTGPHGVVVVPHDPEWARKFESEAAAIRAALSVAALAIHHVGSTAVPGMHAKPIVDILVEAVSVEAVDERTPALEALGYEARGEYGIPGRRYFRKDDARGVRRFHVHAFAAGAEEAMRHLAFRDYLRAHPEAAREYSRLKRELARRYPADSRAYRDGKDPFVEATLRAALAWRRSD